MGCQGLAGVTPAGALDLLQIGVVELVMEKKIRGTWLGLPWSKVPVE